MDLRKVRAESGRRNQLPRRHFAPPPVQASAAAPTPSPRCHPGIYAMLATRNLPLNSRTAAPASVLEGHRAEPAGSGSHPPRVARDALQPAGPAHLRPAPRRSPRPAVAPAPGVGPAGSLSGASSRRRERGLLAQGAAERSRTWGSGLAGETRGSKRNCPLPSHEVLAGDWLGARAGQSQPDQGRGPRAPRCASQLPAPPSTPALLPSLLRAPGGSCV